MITTCHAGLFQFRSGRNLVRVSSFPLVKSFVSKLIIHYCIHSRLHDVIKLNNKSVAKEILMFSLSALTKFALMVRCCVGESKEPQLFIHCTFLLPPDKVYDNDS